MKLLLRLVALFVLLPALELALLVQVDKLIGFWPTIGLILLTGLIGSWLAKREGLSIWQRLTRQLAQGGLPGKELVDGVIILVSGALLITPGVFTDVLGFLGLLPPSRAVIRKIVVRRLERALQKNRVGVSVQGRWSSPFSSSEAGPERASTWQGTAHDLPRYAAESDTPGGGDPE